MGISAMLALSLVAPNVKCNVAATEFYYIDGWCIDSACYAC